MNSPAVKDRIVYIDNSLEKYEPFVVHNCTTVEEVINEIKARFPKLNNDSIGLHVKTSRASILEDFNRKVLPADAENLYITIYLRKH